MASVATRPRRGAGFRISFMVMAAFVGAALSLSLGGCDTVGGTWNALFKPKPMEGPKDATPALPPNENYSQNVQVQKQPQVPSFDNSTAGVASPVGGGTSMNVNSYLWHAALETVSFMPLTSADPVGGVIITDWYSPPETPKERFKLNVYVLGKELRADSLRVSVFRQRQDDGQWQEAAADKLTGTDLEDTILARAQRLRSQALAQ